MLTDEEVERAFYRNQKGDAELFIRLASGRFVYDKQYAADPSKGLWYEFSGNYWQEDVNGNAETHVDKDLFIGYGPGGDNGKSILF